MNADLSGARMAASTAARGSGGRAHALRAPLFLVIVSLLLSGGCATPSTHAPTPSAVILGDDLHFAWYPPASGTRFDIFISAGRYVRTEDDGSFVYYSSEHGSSSRVRAGQPIQRRRGGIAYARKAERYFAWQEAPSYTSILPLNGELDDLKEGRSIRVFLGYLPADAERHLQFAP